MSQYPYKSSRKIPAVAGLMVLTLFLAGCNAFRQATNDTNVNLDTNGLFNGNQNMNTNNGNQNLNSNTGTTTNGNGNQNTNNGNTNASGQVTFNLGAQNNSGQTGTATIQDVNGRARVTIQLDNAPATAEPAHIHVGACPNPGAIKYQLSNVVNGRSETQLTVSAQTVMSQLPLAINVHRSATNLNQYVACGNLPGTLGNTNQS